MIEEETLVALILQEVVVSRSADHRNVGLDNLIYERLTPYRLDKALKISGDESCFSGGKVNQRSKDIRGKFVATKAANHFRDDNIELLILVPVVLEIKIPAISDDYFHGDVRTLLDQLQIRMVLNQVL